MSELWAWTESLDSERWHGPYNSREDAIKAGARAVDPETGRMSPSYYVAPCHYPDPGQYAEQCAEVDDLLERMEEHAGDDGCFSGEDALFEHRSSAELALKKALGAWAREHIRATTFTVDADEAEEIKR